MKSNTARVEYLSKAYIKAMTTEEIEDLLRDNLSPEELIAQGILPKKPVLLETPENNGS